MNLFFLFSGLMLSVIAMIQMVRSVRPSDAPVWMRLLNRDVLRAIVFLVAGVFGFLVGVGVIPVPAPPHRGP